MPECERAKEGGAIAFEGPQKYALSDNTFLVIGVFRRQTFVHIRKYKLYGTKHYPTKEGVAMTPHQFIHLTEPNKKQSRFANTTLPDSSQQAELTVQILPAIVPPAIPTSQYDEHFPLEDRQFLFTRTPYDKDGKYSEGRATSILLTNSEWEELFTHRADIIEHAILFRYADVNLMEVYQHVSGRLIEPLHSQVYLAEATLAEERLRQLFVHTLRQYIIKEGFQPYLYDFDFTPDTKLEDFNMCLLNLNLTELMTSFFEGANLEQDIAIQNPHRVEYFVTMDFFINLSPSEIITELRNAI